MHSPSSSSPIGSLRTCQFFLSSTSAELNGAQGTLQAWEGRGGASFRHRGSEFCPVHLCPQSRARSGLQAEGQQGRAFHPRAADSDGARGLGAAQMSGDSQVDTAGNSEGRGELGIDSAWTLRSPWAGRFWSGFFLFSPSYSRLSGSQRISVFEPQRPPLT